MVVKIIEVMGESEESWEDAAKSALEGASKSIRNIVGMEVKDMTANVKGNNIVKYKACVKIAFMVE